MADRKIFISYRRGDNPDFVARIRDWFVMRYQRPNVFMDFDSIPRFVPFADFIEEKVRECDVLIAIIGPSWLELMQEKAAALQEDFVRIEIELALKYGKLIAPICIKGASVPSAGLLPDSLQPMFKANVAHLNADDTFYDRIDRIMNDIEHALAQRRNSTQSKWKVKANVPSPSSEVQKIIDAVNNSPLPPEASVWNKAQAEWKFTSNANIATLNEVLHLNPRHLNAYNNRGIARYYRKDWDGAIEDFTQIIRLNPVSDNAYHMRANARWEKGDLEGAIADFTQAIRLNPDDSGNYYNRGNVFKVKGDLDSSLKDYDEAIRLKPSFASAHNARAHVRKIKGDLKGALADYTEAIQRKWDLVPIGYGNSLKVDMDVAHNNRAQVNFALQHYDDALADFTKATELKTDYSAALAGLAITQYSLSNVDEARRLWNDLLAKNAHYRDADWVGRQFSWGSPLIEAARKLIATL